MIATPPRARQRRIAWSALSAACLVLGVGGVTVAAEDILDRRATDVRLADWAALAPAERFWWLAGFAVGWHGPSPTVTELALDATAAGQADVVTHVTRKAVEAEAGDRRLAGVLIADGLAGALPLARITGHVWIGLAVRDRLLLLKGFQAGAYASTVRDALGEASDDAIEAAVAQARRRHPTALALAPNLLFARLSDYYFYTDRRDQALVTSIATIAAQLGRR